MGNNDHGTIDDLPVPIQRLIRKLRAEASLNRIERNSARQERDALQAELDALKAEIGR
jgi:hypothetical protein